MMQSSLVSVCIPAFNGATHLEECLDSVCSQTYRELEILIVDDCSTDRTASIIEAYQQRDSRIRLVRNDTNLGLVGNWERCITLASGEFVKFAFHDDVLYPRCVEALVQAMDPGVRFAFCAREFIADDPASRTRANGMQRARQRIHALFADTGLITPAAFSLAVLDVIPTNIVGEPTATMMHRDVFWQYGRFNPDLVQILDFEFWCRVGSNETIRYVPEVLAKFRLHASSTTSRNVAQQLYQAEVIDELLLLHEFAFAPVFNNLREAARKHQRSRDVVDLFYERAHRAVSAARKKINADVNHDPTELKALEKMAARYPALLGSIPLKYVLMREWRRLKKRLRASLN